MRILQVNAVYKTKSTGRIVMEMHRYFKAHGIESYVAYATENTDTSNDPDVFKIGNTLDHKLHALAYRIDNMQGCHSTTATRRFLKKIAILKPDIVLTHNLHSNYLNVPLFLTGLKRLNIHTVIALHDCWFMTGGCYHYTASGCEKWLTGCKKCSKLGGAAEKKYKINCETLELLHPTVVATSKWIEREAERSLLAERTDIKMIYDWIDTETFYPREVSHIRAKYGIGNRTMILGVSSVWSADKGQSEMIKIAEKMPDAVVVLVGGQPDNAEYPKNVIKIAFTDSKEELAELYSAADVFFNPSKQETFGLVSGEALACGTPLAVYNTTACPEFVSEYTGAAAETGSEIEKAVEDVLEKNKKYGREFIRNECRAFAEKNFNSQKNINKYLELFADICG